MPISIRLRHLSRTSLRISRRSKTSSPSRCRFGISRLHHSEVVRKLSDDRAGKAAAFISWDGEALASTFEQMIESTATQSIYDRAVRLSRIVRCYRGRPHGAPPRRAGCPRSHLWSARSAPAAGRSCRARRTGRRHLAAGDAKRSVAQPSDAASSSASICRNGGSACPRMTLRRLWARPTSSSRAPPKSRARRPSRRVFCSASPRSPAKSHGKRRSRRGEKYLDWARALDRPERVKPCRRPAPTPPRRCTAETSDRDRDRALAARPVHDLRKAHSEIARARSGRHAARCARSRNGDPRGHRRLHRALRQSPARRSRGGADRDRTGRFQAAGGLSGSARVLVAALPAHRTLVRGLGNRAPRKARTRSMPRRSAK